MAMVDPLNFSMTDILLSIPAGGMKETNKDGVSTPCRMVLFMRASSSGTYHIQHQATLVLQRRVASIPCLPKRSSPQTTFLPQKTPSNNNRSLRRRK